jgi:hypothetical protein
VGYTEASLLTRLQVSALATQVTYEGILDRMFGLDSGFVRVGEEIGMSTAAINVLLSVWSGGPGEPVVRLYPPDEVYAEIRDLNFSEVGVRLKQRVRRLDTSYEERKTDDCTPFTEYRLVVAQCM